MKKEKEFSEMEIDRIIEMAWEDRTPFEAITFQFGLKEKGIISLMRKELKPSSFKMWRERVQAKATKHQNLKSEPTNRFKSSQQKQITNNKISKR